MVNNFLFMLNLHILLETNIIINELIPKINGKNRSFIGNSGTNSGQASGYFVFRQAIVPEIKPEFTRFHNEITGFGVVSQFCGTECKGNGYPLPRP